MADARPKPRRHLTITSCTEARRGETNGREWVIYQITADNQDGTPVEQNLRSFKVLELGAGEFELERYDPPRGGDASYTLTPIRQKKVPERIEDLERKVHELEARIARLEPQPEPGPGTPAAGDISY